jgi:hypothetical protein
MSIPTQADVDQISQNANQGTIPIPQAAPSPGSYQPAWSPQEMAQAALRANTPTVASHSTATPLNLQPNLKTFTPAPLNNRPAPVGKGNARGQGIGNAVIGVANAITGVVTAEDNKKKLQIATDTHTLLLSQQVIDQASQLQKGDPGYDQAQETIKHNRRIMNGILKDKKTRDAIAKGFKIDFTNPEANKTPDHDAVKQGQQMAEKTLSLADQFGKAVPQQMQQNPRAVAMYQQMVQDNKDALALQKSLGPAYIRASAEVAVQNGRNALEGYKQAQENARKVFELQSQNKIWQNRLTQEHDNKMQELNKEYGMKLAYLDKETQAVNNRERSRLEAADSDPKNIMTSATTSEHEWESTVATTSSVIAGYQAQLAANPKMTQDQKDQINKAIESTQQTLDLQKGYQKQHAAYWDAQKALVTGIPAEGGNADGSRSNSADSGAAVNAINGANWSAYTNNIISPGPAGGPQ